MRKLVTATFLLISTWCANASIINTQISCDIEPSIIWKCDQGIASVSERVTEFNLLLMGNAYLTVDFDSDSLLISNFQSTLGMSAHELLSFTLTPNVFNPNDYDVFSSVLGFDATHIDFDGEALVLDLHSTRWSPQDYILLSFFNNAAVVSNAPTFLLMLVGVFALRRRLINAK